MNVRSLLVLAMPLWLGSCALLVPGEQNRPPAPVATAAPSFPAATLTAGASASAEVRGVKVALTLHNPGPIPVELRTTPQVNWGTCGMPPYVALSRVEGPPISAPAFGGPLTCLDLGLTRLLPPGESLTLRRTLPPLPAGTYRLTAWFDGEADGEPVRLTAPAVTLTAR